MEHKDLLAVALDFAIAISLGALVGIEREKHKREKPEIGQTAGLRTFILLALLGSCAGWLSRELASPWILVAALLIVSALVVVGYLVTTKGKPLSAGMTTEIAAIVVFLLGAIVMLGFPAVAIALAVLTAAVLAYKEPLHGFVEKLGWDDVFAGLRLLIATFIALPLLPDKPIDPWGVLNPYELWLLVILISGLSLVGYALTRWLGPGKGALVTGLAGGLVASTAVTLSFSREARANPSNTAALACGILVAWAIMFARVLVLVAVVNWALLAPMLVPVGVMALVVGGFAAAFYCRDGAVKQSANAQGDLEVTNPFSLTSAVKFAVLFAVVLVAVKIAQENFSANGVYAVAALAGLTDVDAITLSMAKLPESGTAQVAVTAIVIAALVNTAVKCGIAFFVGGRSLGKPLLLATAAMLVAGLASVYLL
ncbi:MAG TPA: MgtC/SapB family protein [Methyloceanibacter sp.]|nr:MgtC/SapB family protein [Methyloceanibacter sp.]